MSDVQLVEQRKKRIDAMVESVVMQKPELRDRLTSAIVLSYLKMPDASFGWTLKGSMPEEIKIMAVAAHMTAGATPGYGHIYFLGNKLYQSAAFVMSKANSDENFKIMGESKFEPLSEPEKDMFGIESGDMACKVILNVEKFGKPATLVGHGIIGKDEIASGKPGLNNKKNRAMTLKTRAMRDLLNRFYPTHGVPVAPDLSEEPEIMQAGFAEQTQLLNNAPDELKQVREEIIEAESEEINDEKREQAKAVYKEISNAAKAKDISTKELLTTVGVKTIKEMFKLDPPEIFSKLEEMQDFIDSKPEAESDAFDEFMDGLSEECEPCTIPNEIQKIVDMMKENSRVSDEIKDMLQKLDAVKVSEMDESKFTTVCREAMGGDIDGLAALVI